MNVNTDELKLFIFDVVSRMDGESINKCYAIYSRIIEADSIEDQADLFKYACEVYGTKKSTKELKTPCLISEEEQGILEKNFGKYVNGVLDNFLRRNLNEVDFYSGLWNMIISDQYILINEKEKVFALYYILIDKRIPYFQLGESVKMSNEEYRETSERLASKKCKIRFILSVPISSKTERAGYLLDLLDEYIDLPKERAVLMSYLVESLKKQRPSQASMLAGLESLQERTLQELQDFSDSLDDLLRI